MCDCMSVGFLSNRVNVWYSHSSLILKRSESNVTRICIFSSTDYYEECFALQRGMLGFSLSPHQLLPKFAFRK